jgi:hypothetical protein
MLCDKVMMLEPFNTMSRRFNRARYFNQGGKRSWKSRSLLYASWSDFAPEEKLDEEPESFEFVPQLIYS